jgi:DNA modification methylase
MSWKDIFPKEGKYFETDNGILYCDDCLEIMKGFPKCEITLIYIDPPYGIDRDRVFGLPKWRSTEDDYRFCDELGLSIVRKIDKRKHSNHGIASYLKYMYERLVLMRELLAENGSIYVHIDWHVGHYVKVMMDEIFGKENFRNEIVWCYTGPSNQQKDFPDKHDVIYRYSKSENYIFNFNEIRIPYVKLDTGKTHGIFKQEATLSEKGKIPEDWWRDITPVARLHATELLNFQTQKPEALLKRIIEASCPEGGIVADFFAGSGTTGVVAEKLGRRWIGCDFNENACKIAKRRIEEIVKQRKLF